MQPYSHSRTARVALLVCIAASMLGCGGTGGAQALVAASVRPAANTAPGFVLVQNPSSPFVLPEMGEPPVSPLNPGTLPGSTAAIGRSGTGTNPITGLPCNGGGSLAISGAGGLPGTTVPPVGTPETLNNIPVGAPPVNSIYGTQQSLGAC
jgi:hypothetical protein